MYRVRGDSAHEPWCFVQQLEICNVCIQKLLHGGFAVYLERCVTCNVSFIHSTPTSNIPPSMTTSLPVIQGVLRSEHIKTAKSPISFGSANLKTGQHYSNSICGFWVTYRSKGVMSCHLRAKALDFSSVLEVVMSVATYLPRQPPCTTG